MEGDRDHPHHTIFATEQQHSTVWIGWTWQTRIGDIIINIYELTKFMNSLTDGNRFVNDAIIDILARLFWFLEPQLGLLCQAPVKTITGYTDVSLTPWSCLEDGLKW